MTDDQLRLLAEITTIRQFIAETTEDEVFDLASWRNRLATVERRLAAANAAAADEKQEEP